jgi:hypothetical protein
MEAAIVPDGLSPLQTASVLSEEPVSDRPRAVCPVLASFLRAYDDVVEGAKREDVTRYAVLSIGTRGGVRVRVRRARRSRDLCRGLGVNPRPGRSAGAEAARALLAVEDPDERHEIALAFADELIEIGGSPDLPPDVRRLLRGATTRRSLA